MNGAPPQSKSMFPDPGISRRSLLGGLVAGGVWVALAPGHSFAAGTAGNLKDWLRSKKPGIHVLTHVPTFHAYKLKQKDRRFPDALYAKAVETAWGIMGPSLGPWIGGAFHYPWYYVCCGGHADSGLDSIYRVNIVTGAVDVTRPSPLVRPFKTKKGTVFLPERDDYLQGHIYASIVALDQDHLWIGHWSLFAKKLMYFEDDLPVAWDVRFDQQDKLGYPKRKSLPFRHAGGLYALLPNGSVFMGTPRKLAVADQSGKILHEENTPFGWGGCYHPAHNTVYGIDYNGVMRATALDDNFLPKQTMKLATRAEKRWDYGAGIAPHGDRLLIFPGTGSYYLLDPKNGKVEEERNLVYQERRPNVCFNRFIALDDGVFLYIPTEQTGHVRLWIMNGSET